VLCVTGYLRNASAVQRLAGLKQGLDGKFDLIELNGDWTSEGARMAVARWASEITSKEDLPGMFVAHNDEMALGVRQAARDVDSQRNLPLARTPITGCDGSQTFGQRLVRERRLQATVITPPDRAWPLNGSPACAAKGEMPPVRCCCRQPLSRASEPAEVVDGRGRST